VTELVWEGKYRDGKRVAPVRIALPFQTVETINESARDRARTLDLFSSGKPTEWRNRLIWGDKKYVLPSLLPEFTGKVNLAYVDPPFATGADFSFTTEIPDTDESLVKQPSMLEQKAYRDTWGRGLDSYLQWFYETAVLLRELLSDDGSLYVHLDANIGHYAKAVLDEVFGEASFQRELVWRIGWISGYKSTAKNWIRNHDTILFYVKDR
jgi:adenine specific DNA methylase Mod